MAKIVRAAKNSHFAIVAAPAAIPEKPKNPATTDNRKKINAHLSIRSLFLYGLGIGPLVPTNPAARQSTSPIRRCPDSLYGSRQIAGHQLCSRCQMIPYCDLPALPVDSVFRTAAVPALSTSAKLKGGAFFNSSLLVLTTSLADPSFCSVRTIEPG